MDIQSTTRLSFWRCVGTPDRNNSPHPERNAAEHQKLPTRSRITGYPYGRSNRYCEQPSHHRHYIGHRRTESLNTRHVTYHEKTTRPSTREIRRTRSLSSMPIDAVIERNTWLTSSGHWHAGPCLAGEANSKFGAPLFVTVANLLETSISNYLLYGILLSIFDFQD